MLNETSRPALKWGELFLFATYICSPSTDTRAPALSLKLLIQYTFLLRWVLYIHQISTVRYLGAKARTRGSLATPFGSSSHSKTKRSLVQVLTSVLSVDVSPLTLSLDVSPLDSLVEKVKDHFQTPSLWRFCIKNSFRGLQLRTSPAISLRSIGRIPHYRYIHLSLIFTTPFSTQHKHHSRRRCHTDL